MASSGTITLSTQSVDYPCCPYGRGAVTLTNVIGWTVNDSSYISFNLISSSCTWNTWALCYGTNPYYIEMVPQVSYDGGASWENLDVKRHLVDHQCITPGVGTDTVAMSTTLINSLGSYYLRANCILRFLYYMTVAPAPDADFRNAFPNSSYSEAVQVPVHVDVSWTATMRYDANGGTGAPGNTTGTSTASTQTLTVSNTVPTRKNYRFDGWSYSGNLYHGGDTIVIQKSAPTITLVAAWTKFYHPGAVLNGDTQWMSHDRASGACQVLADVSNDTWNDMRTIDAPTGLGDPPAVYHDAKYFNQQKVGKE